MTKKTKIALIALSSVLFLVGLILIMFYKYGRVYGGLSCIFLGVGMIVLGIHNKYHYEEKYLKLSQEVDIMNKDIEENQEGSQFYDIMNDGKTIKKAYKSLKRNDRTHISLFVAGIAFILLSFFVFWHWKHARAYANYEE